MNKQLNLFGSQKMKIDEAQELTLASLREYGSRHKHWAVAWSGGKDSTCLATMLIHFLESGAIERPESLTILYADTRMELPPLEFSAMRIIDNMRQKGYNVNVVMADIDDRFLVYMLGKGVPPPSNTFRWCTGKIKVEPMQKALKDLYEKINEGKAEHEPKEKILMLTGVRQGESAVRDGRIAMSCSKNGSECGQGWYQTGLDNSMCATLAPILHFRVCLVWDWLKIFAPRPEYGGWETKMLADAYGGDEAEEINARTGCIGCPLASKDKALDTILKNPEYKYLGLLKELRVIYTEMRKAKYRLRKTGYQVTKSGKGAKNQNRLGPLTIQSRRIFLRQVLMVQNQINDFAKEFNKPEIDILNKNEVARIKELWDKKVFPKGWEGTEQTGDMPFTQTFADGSFIESLFFS